MRVRAKEREWKHIPWHKEEVEKKKRKKEGARLALNQSQPLGNSRFLAHIEAMTGIRRETRPRGRPRKEASDPQTASDSDQGELGI